MNIPPTRLKSLSELLAIAIRSIDPPGLKQTHATRETLLIPEQK